MHRWAVDPVRTRIDLHPKGATQAIDRDRTAPRVRPLATGHATITGGPCPVNLANHPGHIPTARESLPMVVVWRTVGCEGGSADDVSSVSAPSSA
jgi:hypothetical protein